MRAKVARPGPTEGLHRTCPWVYKSTMRRWGIALIAVLVAAGAADAGAKAKRAQPFRLPLPAEGSTATRVMKVNLVKRTAASTAATRLKLRISVKNPGALPDGMAVSGRLWRARKQPSRATIAITAFRPKAGSSGRAHAAQLETTIVGNARTSLFDLGIYGGGAWTTDWFSDAPEFPTTCLLPSGPPLSESDVLANNWTYDLDLVWRPLFWGAVCGDDVEPFASFMRTGQLPGAAPPGPDPPTITMSAFPGNPFEASIFIGYDTPFDAVRMQAGPDTSFSQCFSGGRPCTVDSPGTNGNFVLFEFPDGPVTQSGELNVRASNNEFSQWDPPSFFLSAPGDPAFSGPFPPAPPP